MDTIGLAVDPLIAKANHSCSPNAYVMFDGPRLLLRSMRDIEEDEEITIQYVDVLNCRIRRREELKERYYFECQCPQCDTEENDPLAAGLQAAISDNLAVLRNQRGWRQAIVALKENLFFASQECHCQKQKQPLPSLHHELFIALLSAQRWVEAFQQGLWIYFEIHPIIYPKFIQPTRTVHSYSLAKLAILLHSDEQAQQSGGTTLKLPEPLDLAQVVVLFLTEAEEALVRSHGQDNSLTREAKAKADDMRKQMAGKLLSQPDAQWALLKEFAGG